MNGNYYAIDIWGLIAALVMVAIAAGISETMRMGVGRTLLWSACRALLQLCAMGFIMEYVIRSNNPWLVLLLVAFMLIAAVQITLSRAKGVPKGLAGPVFLSLVVTMLIMISLVTELIIRPQPWYAPQLVVPLTGMLLGNTVSALAVGLSRFFESMKERRDEVDTLLALGATTWEAARPSIVSSIRLGLLPTTASLASAGIVTVPGMMAGQIIAGGNPIGILEVNEAASLIAQAADADANIIFGAAFDDELQDEMRVTVIATGFEMKPESFAPSAGADKTARPSKPSFVPDDIDTPVAASKQPTKPADMSDIDEIFSIFKR